MAKRKRPEDVSPEELAIHKEKDFIANHATRSEKTAWQRQYENLSKLVRKLEPIEDKLMNLIAEKSKILDEVFVLRKELVESCIHPFDDLIKHDGTLICKFCEKRMAVPHDGESTKASEAEGTSSNS